MKKIISTALLITSFSSVSCDGIQADISSNTVEPETMNSLMGNPKQIKVNSPLKTDSIQKTANGEPKVATIKNMIQGDLKCYVILVDEQGVKQEVDANFDICAQSEKFLSKKVNLAYDTVKVNDCQSNEPCGKTKDESLIVKMDVLGTTSTTPKNSPDIVTLSNGTWTITLGNRNSWNGANGTGNLIYYGCKSGGKCIKLRGGKVTCRQGECTTVWKNGNQDYIVKSGITTGNGKASVSPSTLIIRQSDQVIATAEGLKPLN